MVMMFISICFSENISTAPYFHNEVYKKGLVSICYIGSSLNLSV